MEQMSVYTTGYLIDYQLFFSLVMFSVIFFSIEGNQFK